MKSITFYFDPISPFAYLAFERLPQALEGCSYVVNYQPVLFASLLQHHAHKGPAEIESKRAWTFRHVHWLAHQHGVTLHTPAMHPFNPLPLLRLAVACGVGGRPNRKVVETLFRYVWLGGADPNDPARLAALTAQLAPTRDAAGDDVKRELRDFGNAALAAGVFGVPSFELEGRVFWGLDALPMLRDALLGGDWFQGPAWAAAAVAPPGIKR
jgi:2-hydroxychromene-2-carboxylate isomerase